MIISVSYFPPKAFLFTIFNLVETYDTFLFSERRILSVLNSFLASKSAVADIKALKAQKIKACGGLSKKAILLDTQISEKNKANKKGSTTFMHYICLLSVKILIGGNAFFQTNNKLLKKIL